MCFGKSLETDRSTNLVFRYTYNREGNRRKQQSNSYVKIFSLRRKIKMWDIGLGLGLVRGYRDGAPVSRSDDVFGGAMEVGGRLVAELPLLYHCNMNGWLLVGKGLHGR